MDPKILDEFHIGTMPQISKQNELPTLNIKMIQYFFLCDKLTKRKISGEEYTRLIGTKQTIV